MVGGALISKIQSTHEIRLQHSRPRAYAVLFLLECEFTDAGRILSGFKGDERDTWNRKGLAGVVEKRAIQLESDLVAYELRTLKVSAVALPAVLRRLDQLVRAPDTVSHAKAITVAAGLPWEPWTEAEFRKFAGHLSTGAAA